MQRPQERRSTVPSTYSDLVEAALKRRGYSLGSPKRLADAVKQLSDFYLENPTAQTPWDQSWAQAASIAYFFPLNYSRSALVAREADRLGFFNGLTSLTDDGSGMGSGIHAFRDHFKSTNSIQSAFTWAARDISSPALALLKELTLESGSAPATQIQTLMVRGLERPHQPSYSHAALLASYVLTELPEIPSEWLKSEALILIEPSSRDDARRLQGERKTLQEAGFVIWGPCPHQDECPLLIHSDKDWCHDRLHFDAPQWFTEIEKHLPMKNRTLSFSYLLARKKPSPVRAADGYARLVGDTLPEKGKTRQAVCRSSQKEFLSWFPQRMPKGESLELERGSLIEIKTQDLEVRGLEVRLKSSHDVRELATDERLSMKD